MISLEGRLLLNFLEELEFHSERRTAGKLNNKGISRIDSFSAATLAAQKCLACTVL